MNKPTVLQNDAESLAGLFAPRKPDTSKADYGKALIVGGSSNYVGAPTFSLSSLAETLTALGKASMLVGAGTSSLVVPDFLVEAIYPTLQFSAVVGMPSENGVMKFSENEFSKFVKGKCAVAIGMGMGNTDVKPFLNFLLENTDANFVVDADALRWVDGIDFGGRAVFTPHVGEFSRITGRSVQAIKENPIEYAMEVARERNSVVVLKDNVSYITDGTVVYENRTGNPSLAKGGSGDVLAGIICGLLAIGFSPLDAGRCGSYLLGRAAELNTVNEYSSLPTDVINFIAPAVGELCKSNKE